jgi:hypothetical protein
MSFIEAVTNVTVGFGVAVLTQAALYPILGIQVSVAINAVIGAVFTFVSIVRSYVLRRVFEGILIRQRGGMHR